MMNSLQWQLPTLLLSDADLFSVSQWTIAELACYTYSMVAVPLYDTLGTEAIGYIIDQGKHEGTCKPTVVLSRCSTLRILTPIKRLIERPVLFLSGHLNGDLRRSRQGSVDSGLCEREGENGKEDCAHGGVWSRPGHPRTRVRRWDTESEGLWGENKNLLFILSCVRWSKN